MTSSPIKAGLWFNRFLWLAIVNGALAAGWTVFMIWPWLTPAPSMVLAEGSAGTWLLFGYVLFLVVGVLGAAVTAIFYFFLEGIQGRVYTSLRSVIAWGHLALMEAGVVGTTFLMMYGGYRGGVGLLATSEGGGGLTAYQVHVQILQYYINPVGAFVAVAVLGMLLGGMGYVLSMRKTR